MKRIIFLSILSLFVCSCKKSPSDLLIGSWEITVTMDTQTNVGGTTFDASQSNNYIYTFENNGNCTVIYVKDNYRWKYTYFYDDVKQVIAFADNKRNSIETWAIDVITKNRIVAHYEMETNGVISTKTLMTIIGVKK